MAIHYITDGNINAGIVASIVIGIDTSKNYTLTMGNNGGPPSGNDTAPGNRTEDNNAATTSTNAATTSTTGGAVGEFTIFPELLTPLHSTFVLNPDG